MDINSPEFMSETDDASELWDNAQEQAEKQLEEAVLQYAKKADKAYVLSHFDDIISTKADTLFSRVLKNTLGQLHGMSGKQATQRFILFMKEGFEAFSQAHTPPSNLLEQQVQASLRQIRRQEGWSSRFYTLLRSTKEANKPFCRAIRMAILQRYHEKGSAFTARDLRQRAFSDKGLKRAFQDAEKQYTYKTRYTVKAVLDYIPEDYADLYPMARSIDRHFILHVGPTNSGKTYAAIQALRHAQDGIYLAPLRLLAYEQFDSMNRNGIICNLKTGEERVSLPCATVQASTIEMLDERHFHDVVVIDEAQMIQDPMRGGHWTKAILGAYADEIHVCLAPEAESIVIRMIKQCHDTFEVVHHERFNQLLPDKVENVKFPRAVEPGDAYIVFSRSSAHACVAELQKHGINPSIIYGALPYDVRQNEARRFREGETTAVVATDAIGMGLNLPIRRVIFLETEKFDGVSKRGLSASEYKQIAGRAGRYGQYEHGLYVSPYEMDRAIEAVNAQIPAIRQAHLLFPDALLGMDAPLSAIMRMWMNAPINEGYRKEDLTQQISLAELLEQHFSDKQMIYSLVSMPFDAQRPAVYDLWLSLASECLRKQTVRLEKYIPDIDALCKQSSMVELENSYRLYDLLYYFAERFDTMQLQRITDERKMVSAMLMKILAQSKLPPKTCKKCHKPMQWNSPFSLCKKCAGIW